MTEVNQLLAQADALMRRSAPAEGDFPVLTEVVTPAVAAVAGQAEVGARKESPNPVPALGVGALENPSDQHWQALREELYHRVLQSLDLYADQVVQTYLRTRLQPILERAVKQTIEQSIAGITQEMGSLLRNYIAQALDQEIIQARQRPQNPLPPSSNP